MGPTGMVPVSLDLGATVKAEFRAEIKAEIPSSSAGRLIDSLTDIIRPFTEARGLRADLIRLQREDILIEIAQKAQLRLKTEGEAPGPISNKVLIPLLERASWTDPNDKVLIDAWATLLASTSSNLNPNSGIFSDVLGKLESEHVRFLAWLSRNGTDGHYQDVALELSEERVRTQLAAIGKEFGKKKIDVGQNEWVQELITSIIEVFKYKGNCLTSGAIIVPEFFGIFDYYEFGSGLDDSNTGQSVAEALVSLNLLSDVFLETIPLFNGCEVWVHYYRLTGFGGDFVASCTSEQSP